MEHCPKTNPPPEWSCHTVAVAVAAVGIVVKAYYNWGGHFCVAFLTQNVAILLQHVAFLTTT